MTDNEFPYPEVEYTKEDAIRDDLYRWWMDIAHVEAEACAEKAVEYGSHSMTELGHEIAKLSDRKITDAEAIELACYFYIKGKLGRWSDAIVAGKAVSNDTIRDIGVYVRMVQRVRDVGDWPGEPGKVVSGYSAGSKIEVPNHTIGFDDGTLTVRLYDYPLPTITLEEIHQPNSGHAEISIEGIRLTDAIGNEVFPRSHPGQDLTQPSLSDEEPQPSSGPDYFAERQAWVDYQKETD